MVNLELRMRTGRESPPHNAILQLDGGQQPDVVA